MRQFSAPNMRLDRVPENDWVEEAYYYDEYMSEDDADDYSQKSVPIWLSLCLVIAYIVWGAFIFQVVYTAAARRKKGFVFQSITSAFSGMGGLVPLGQQLLLLHYSDHHRLRRPRAQSAESGRGTATGALLTLLALRHRHDCHELQSGPGASHQQCQDSRKTTRHSQGR